MPQGRSKRHFRRPIIMKSLPLLWSLFILRRTEACSKTPHIDNTLSTTTNTRTLILQCKPGYALCAFGKFCFKAFPVVTDQPTALAACIADGGNLASFHSAGENQCGLDAITAAGIVAGPGVGCTNLVTLNLVWFGLTRTPPMAGNPTAGQWSDGTPVDFIMYLPGQPDNTCGNEQCVSYFLGTPAELWADIDCDYMALGYVCKQPQTLQ